MKGTSAERCQQLSLEEDIADSKYMGASYDSALAVDMKAMTPGILDNFYSGYFSMPSNSPRYGSAFQWEDSSAEAAESFYSGYYSMPSDVPQYGSAFI